MSAVKSSEDDKCCYFRFKKKQSYRCEWQVDVIFRGSLVKIVGIMMFESQKSGKCWCGHRGIMYDARCSTKTLVFSETVGKVLDFSSMDFFENVSVQRKIVVKFLEFKSRQS